MFGHSVPLSQTNLPSVHGRLRFRPILIGLLGVALLAGPAPSQAQSAWDAVPSSKAPALPVEGLAEQEHTALDKVLVRPGVNLSTYGKIMLVPIDMAVERRFDDVLLSVRERNHALEYFGERLTAELGNALVSAPGAGVLRLHITVTEYVPNLSYHAERANGGSVDRVYAVGRAGFQATLTDTQTGLVVAAIADADMGLPFPDNVNTHSLYGDADRFTRKWAKQLTKLVTSGPTS